MDDYPLLDLFWTMLYFFLWILWIFLLIRIISDIFRSADLGGWGKAGWTILLICLPLIGALVYLIFRGEGMYTRDNQRAAANQQAMQRYVQQAVRRSAADELAKLAALRDHGVLSEVEFEAQKAKLLL